MSSVSYPVGKTKQRWSFAAVAPTQDAVEPAVRASLEHAIDKAGSDAQQIEQMYAAAKVVTRMVESGLWGSGPFSLALSGSEHSFFLSAISQEDV